MTSVTRLWVAWELHQAGQKPGAIAEQLGVHRATVYRWLKGMRQWGIREYVRRFQQAKKGRRRRKTHAALEQRVLAIRRQHHDCCGEKIVYWLAQAGIRLSRSTVYRILNKHLRLRAKGRHNRTRGPLPGAAGPRQVIQMDTIDLGGVYAFTAIDIHTREGQVVLRPGLTSQDGQAALAEVMAYFGRCQLLQTDGGSEFAGDFARAVPDYARFHRVARPYRCNEQAFIERFNRTVRQECLGWGKYRPEQIPDLQRLARRWLDYYHFVRPCMAFSPMHPPCSPNHDLSHLI
ncbi:MAG TPA: helix-turn-helix domain-containing protein [Promineifilum sp.]